MASRFDHSGISPSETRAVIFESKVFFRIQLKLGDGTGPSVIDSVHRLENDSQDKNAYQEISQRLIEEPECPLRQQFLNKDHQPADKSDGKQREYAYYYSLSKGLLEKHAEALKGQ